MRSIVDFNAIASRPEDIACTWNQSVHDDFICLDIFHGTIKKWQWRQRWWYRWWWRCWPRWGWAWTSSKEQSSALRRRFSRSRRHHCNINTSQLDVFFLLTCFFSVVDMTHKRSYSYKFDGQMTFIALHFSVTFVTAYLLVILKLSFCFWHVLPFGYPKTNVLLTHLFSVLTWLTFWLS